ncbi:MAG TPA: YetF domain-containing protein [Pyrinomonadaceae bacterium]|jgi:uncharacterized membrane protein YcaP (DUF421 family)|nr:YetF domain-containing protein [Pyrinomonadaceae bacterium]
MESVLRAVAIYLFLIILLRIAGKRALSEVSNFEFVLMLVVGEATGQAVIGKDFSITNAYLVILTLVALQILMSFLKERSETVQRWFDGLPVILVENGKPLKERLDKVRVGEDAILAAARELQGLERMDQIKYAVMESNGIISIIPKDGEG